MAGRLDLRLRNFKGAVHFPPEDKGKDVSELEALDGLGRERCPSCAAFFGASFVKGGGVP